MLLSHYVEEHVIQTYSLSPLSLYCATWTPLASYFSDPLAHKILYTENMPLPLLLTQ